MVKVPYRRKKGEVERDKKKLKSGKVDDGCRATLTFPVKRHGVKKELGLHVRCPSGWSGTMVQKKLAEAYMRAYDPKTGNLKQLPVEAFTGEEVDIEDLLNRRKTLWMPFKGMKMPKRPSIKVDYSPKRDKEPVTAKSKVDAEKVWRRIKVHPEIHKAEKKRQVGRTGEPFFSIG